jgi:RimJ/RimL family protein N-acetyltransferase
LIRCVFEPKDAIKAFIEKNITRCRERGLPGRGACIGVINEKNELIGGIYYHDFDPDAGVIEMSSAATDKRWLTRRTLYTLFSYPFNQLGCQMVAARHSTKDKALARIFRAYGFKQVIIPRLFGRDDDAIISTLTVEDWRSNGFHKH